MQERWSSFSVEGVSYLEAICPDHACVHGNLWDMEKDRQCKKKKKKKSQIITKTGKTTRGEPFFHVYPFQPWALSDL